MLTVKEMIAKVRQTIHDEKELEYSDVELTNYLNDGNRILRRTAMSVRPEVLVQSLHCFNVEQTEDAEGNATEVITGKYVADRPFTRVLRVMQDDMQLIAIGTSEIGKMDVSGLPKYYYITGFDTVNFYPQPTNKHKYRIDYISDLSLLELADDVSPYPLVLDDLLIEYAVLRSSISDEFNMQKETALLGTIVEQIEAVLRNLAPLHVTVDGYWDSPVFPIRRW